MIKNFRAIHSSNLCCVTGDQRVVTSEGIYTVVDLWKQGKKNIVAGSSGRTQATEMVLTIENSPVVEIQTKEGYTHKVTPDHPVFVNKKGLIEAKDLLPGDNIQLQQTSGIYGTKDFPKEAFLAGQFARRIGKRGEGLSQDELWKNQYFIKNEIEAKTGEEISYGCIPNFVWQGNLTTIREYLRGVYLNHGLLFLNLDTKVIITLTRVMSLNFNKELQILLISLGIKSRIRKEGKGGHALLLTSLADNRVFYNITELDQEVQFSRFNEIDLTKKVLYPQKLYTTFIGLKILPNEDVYCLKVEAEDRLWTCNGLMTKNTENLF